MTNPDFPALFLLQEDVIAQASDTEALAARVRNYFRDMQLHETAMVYFDDKGNEWIFLETSADVETAVWFFRTASPACRAYHVDQARRRSEWRALFEKKAA